MFPHVLELLSSVFLRIVLSMYVNRYICYTELPYFVVWLDLLSFKSILKKKGEGGNEANSLK